MSEPSKDSVEAALECSDKTPFGYHPYVIPLGVLAAHIAKLRGELGEAVEARFKAVSDLGEAEAENAALKAELAKVKEYPAGVFYDELQVEIGKRIEYARKYVIADEISKALRKDANESRWAKNTAEDRARLLEGAAKGWAEQKVALTKERDEARRQCDEAQNYAFVLKQKHEDHIRRMGVEMATQTEALKGLREALEKASCHMNHGPTGLLEARAAVDAALATPEPAKSNQGNAVFNCAEARIEIAQRESVEKDLAWANSIKDTDYLIASEVRAVIKRLAESILVYPPPTPEPAKSKEPCAQCHDRKFIDEDEGITVECLKCAPPTPPEKKERP